MQINVMSFNIRIDVPVDGKHAWPYREKHVLSFINQEKPDLLGIQEAGPHMVLALRKHLIDYDLFVEPRDEKGESTPVLIKKGIFKIIDVKTIWLTETPSVKSSIEGSNHPRIATYVILETKNKEIIHFFNTHLDYTGDHVTLRQVKHLYNYILQIEEKYKGKTIICGDFNSYPNTQTIQFLNKFYQSCYQDSSKASLTFHGFSNQTEGEPIDYILFSKQLKLDKFTIHEHRLEDQYLSDHYPISTTLNI
ncbi:MAG: endonuclease/exonuclease/phosphatase family protein [Acholeplasmataceae bacterium]|jgi:endonuclease/exonuclease/phosphatase family metal-dependent hydrolase|nr:endonuclease/exonuclease/phosphatase family protein [Acholeplasmataceae bacterium]